MRGDETIYALPSTDDYGTPGQPLPPPVPRGNRFSQRDEDLLKECRDESFYYRCVPFMMMGGLATHVAVQSGRLAPHPTYGSVLKVAGSALVGFFLGKMSYMPECRRKLMEDPQSLVGKRMRERLEEIREGGVPREFKQEDHPSNDDVERAADPSAEWTHNYYDEMRRRNRSEQAPTPYEGQGGFAQPGSANSPYDEMRRQNRNGRPPPPPGYSGPSPSFPPPSPFPDDNSDYPPPSQKRSGPTTNAYGDVLQDV